MNNHWPINRILRKYGQWVDIILFIENFLIIIRRKRTLMKKNKEKDGKDAWLRKKNGKNLESELIKDYFMKNIIRNLGNQRNYIFLMKNYLVGNKFYFF
jgi:hypothetical protein